MNENLGRDFLIFFRIFRLEIRNVDLINVDTQIDSEANFTNYEFRKKSWGSLVLKNVH